MKEKIEFTTPYFESFRCNKIATTYDLEIGKARTRTIEYDAPPSIQDDDSWRIGVIVGPSGSGKSSVARKHYGNALYDASESRWNDEPLVENFDKSLSFEDISGTLTSVGFGSIPCWTQPYKTLSNGEKFRCDLARALLETNQKLVVFDEYTSVVDRTVAKTASFALNKALRRNNAISSKKFVAITCHYDVLPWLGPDWVLDMRMGNLSRVRLRRPKLIVKVYRSSYELWPLFSKYHYLTGKIVKNCRCYAAFIDGRQAAFLATINSMGHARSRRVHRLVVLPEFQGIGLGTKFANFVGEYETEILKARRLGITTSNAFFARSLIRTGRWLVTERNVCGLVRTGVKRHSREVAADSFGRTGRARTQLKFVGNKENEQNG